MSPPPTAAAGLMRGFAGFGSGMLKSPVFAILFGPVETVAAAFDAYLTAGGQRHSRAV